MSIRSWLRPCRELAFPFVVVPAPLLWMIHREMEIDPGTGAAATSRAVVVVAAVALSYLVACLVAAGYDLTDASRSRRRWWLSAPSNRALLLFVGLAVALVLYGLGVLALPSRGESVAALVGVVVGWPLLLASLAIYFGSNSLPGELPFVAQLVVVAVGVSLSTAWTSSSVAGSRSVRCRERSDRDRAEASNRPRDRAYPLITSSNDRSVSTGSEKTSS